MANTTGRSLGAVGIGVSDMARSVDFYTRVLGMEQLHAFSLPDMEEVVLGFPGSASVALMHYTDGSRPHYADNPVKLAFYVPDQAALVEAIRAEGLEILREPESFPALKLTVALAKDPDGYTVELLEPARG